MDSKAAVKILEELDGAAECTVTVFGDFCLDKYLYIDSKRDEPSVETGLTAYQVHEKKLFPGAGGTITNNLRALGAKVYCVGLYGDDGDGHDLIRQLEETGADTQFMVKSAKIQTNTYVKPMRKGQDGEYREMNRIDIRNFTETTNELEEKLLANLEKAVQLSEGVIVLEQFLEWNCGTVTERIREALAELGQKYKDKFFYADSRGYVDRYRGVVVKCNQYEAIKAAGEDNDDPEDAEALKRCGKALNSRNGKPVVVTAGARGAYVFEEGNVYEIPSFRVEGPIDIVGAGDATNAGIGLGLSLGLELKEAVVLGGCISSITIQQIGVTGVATVGQIKERLKKAIKD